MDDKSRFFEGIAKLDLQHVERAVALLWYSNQQQNGVELTATAIADELQNLGFPKPNVTRLRYALARSKFTVKGRIRGTCRLDVRQISALNDEYEAFLGSKPVKVTSMVLPENLTGGTRKYLERLCFQINGSYEYGFYDACAVLARRLMESLIIEVYVHRNRSDEIKANGALVPLERLVAHISCDTTVHLGRGTSKVMSDVKSLGDTAAHDRTYITHQQDIDDLKSKFRKLIQELLSLAGIVK